jgi:hypothetical protein
VSEANAKQAVLGPDRIEEWKAIAAAVGVSVTSVRELADPKRKFQLPVRYGARGVYVARAALEGWFAQYDAPYGAHASLKAPRRPDEKTPAT